MNIEDIDDLAPTKLAGVVDTTCCEGPGLVRMIEDDIANGHVGPVGTEVVVKIDWPLGLTDDFTPCSDYYAFTAGDDDALASCLFQMSLSKKVVEIGRVTTFVPSQMKEVVMIYELNLHDCERDGSTNITPDFIDALKKSMSFEMSKLACFRRSDEWPMQ